MFSIKTGPPRDMSALERELLDFIHVDGKVARLKEAEWFVAERMERFAWEQLDGFEVRLVVKAARDDPFLKYRESGVFLALAAFQQAAGHAVMAPRALDESATADDFVREYLSDHLLGVAAMHRCDPSECEAEFSEGGRRSAE